MRVRITRTRISVVANKEIIIKRIENACTIARTRISVVANKEIIIKRIENACTLARTRISVVAIGKSSIWAECAR
jgi:predicted XRE-type DNA-binding protein